MGAKNKNLRGEERVRTSLPVTLEGGSGTTRDVSVSGIYFETTRSGDIGSEIRFSIDLDAPGGRMVLKCAGHIVRKEPLDKRVGVAVQITESRLEAA